MCLLPTAEVLTDCGWITLANLNINDVKIATLNPITQMIYYQTATEMTKLNYNSDIDGKLLHIKTPNIHTVITPTHKNYVKLPTDKKFKLCQIADCHKKIVKFKLNGDNDIASTTFPQFHTYPVLYMTRLISDWIVYSDLDDDGCVKPFETYQNDFDDINRYFHNRILIRNITIERIQKYIIQLSKLQAKKVLEKLTKYRPKNLYLKHHSVDVLQHLTLHAGLAITVIDAPQYNDSIRTHISKTKLEPTVDLTNFSSEYYDLDYVGEVVRLLVPNGIFYYRESILSPACWTSC